MGNHKLFILKHCVISKLFSRGNSAMSRFGFIKCILNSVYKTAQNTCHCKEEEKKNNEDNAHHSATKIYYIREGKYTKRRNIENGDYCIERKEIQRKTPFSFSLTSTATEVKISVLNCLDFLFIYLFFYTKISLI